VSDWNPNSTQTKGMEWGVLLSGAYTVPGQFVPAIALRQTVSEATGFARVALGTRGATGGLYVVEAYDNETAVPANVTTLQAQPNEDVSGMGTGLWVEESHATGTIYTQIDEVGAANLADYIQLDVPLGGVIYNGRLNTGGLTLTGKRILAVRLNAVVVVAGAAALEFGLNLSGSKYVGRTNIVNVVNQPVSATWLYNPATKLPWRIADVQALDTSDEYYLDGGAFPGAYLAVYQVWLDVVICDENRLAFGVLDDTLGALTPNAWNTVTLTTPTAGTWTKDGAGYHLYLMRRLNSTGSFNVPFLESWDHVAPNPAHNYNPVLDPTYGYATAMGSALPAVLPLFTRTTAPADSVDGQPYARTQLATVRNGQPAEMEFSNAAAANYGLLRFLVHPHSATGSLLVTVKRRSDNVQIGGTLTVTPASLSAQTRVPNTAYYWIQGQLSSVAGLAAATQYYLQFTTSSSGTGEDYWSVVVADTNGSGSVAGFGGTTDRALSNGSELDAYDIYATLSTVPVAPANFTATLTTQTVAASICGITTIQRASLAWTATALGAGFTRYDIARSLDGGTTWTTFRQITTEATATAIDYEAPFGIAVQYRIRVVRSDGAVGDWSSVGTVTKNSTNCVLYLVSNYDPTYNMVLDYQPDVDYDFLESADRVTHPIYGQDDNLSFIPLEDRGTRANWKITVEFNGTGQTAQGKAAFTSLRNIAKAPLPYVRVLDLYGNTMAATLAVPSGTQFMPGRVYSAEVNATEVVDTFVVQN